MRQYWDLGSSVNDVKVQVLSTAPNFFNKKTDKSFIQKGLSVFFVFIEIHNKNEKGQVCTLDYLINFA